MPTRFPDFFHRELSSYRSVNWMVYSGLSHCTFTPLFNSEVWHMRSCQGVDVKNPSRELASLSTVWLSITDHSRQSVLRLFISKISYSEFSRDFAVRHRNRSRGLAPSFRCQTPKPDSEISTCKFNFHAGHWKQSLQPFIFLFQQFSIWNAFGIRLLITEIRVGN